MYVWRRAGSNVLCFCRCDAFAEDCPCRMQTCRQSAVLLSCPSGHPQGTLQTCCRVGWNLLLCHPAGSKLPLAEMAAMRSARTSWSMCCHATCGPAMPHPSARQTGWSWRLHCRTRPQRPTRLR